MRHSMSHFALGNVCFCHIRSTHCSKLSPSPESLLRHKLRCFFPSFTVLTEIRPWRREWSKRGPCHESDGGHGPTPADSREVKSWIMVLTDRSHALGSVAAVTTSDHTVIMCCLQGCRITLRLALRSAQTGVLIETLVDPSATRL